MSPKTTTAMTAEAARLKRQRTHCKRGHELVGRNLGWKVGVRYCLACRREREWYYRRGILPPKGNNGREVVL